MHADDAVTREALAWLRTRRPEAQACDICGAPSSILEARTALGCDRSCRGAEECKFRGYRPALFEEDGKFVVRWGRCRKAGTPRKPQAKEPSLCPVPAMYNDCRFSAFQTEGRAELSGLLRHVQESAARGGFLTLIGPAGSGKTRLAAACANNCEASGGSLLFFTGMEYFEMLRASFDGGPKMEEKARAANLVVFDDICRLPLSEWCSGKFLDIIDFRYRHRLATVVTAGLPTAAALSRSLGAKGTMCVSRLCDSKAGKLLSTAAPAEKRQQRLFAEAAAG